MAEVYGVYDWRALPLVTAATLAQGLPASSRTVRSVAGIPADTDTMLLAVIADRLGHIAWMFSEDGQHGRNHPPSILAELTEKHADRAAEGYDSAEDFLAAWAAIGGEPDA